MKEIDVTCKQRKYPIIIKNDFNGLEKYISNLNSTLVVITDRHIEPLYLEELVDYLKSKQRKVIYFVIDAGEESKSLNVVKEIYSFLLQNGIERKDYLIGLGGGVVGDLVGFVAATYLRGIRLIHIPTSLLAQVDSSIGGKTAVNLMNVKNVIGAFYQPYCVYTNYSLLKTLPEEEIRNGLVEILVHAIIREDELFNFIEQNLDAIKKLDCNLIEELIFRNCKIKSNIVQTDEKESGLRAILNFGHTFGHAIEGCCNYSYKHGECVALGILGACYLSEELGVLSSEVTERIKKLLARINPFVNIHDKQWDDIYQFMIHDKKVNNNQIRFVLLREMGDVIVQEVDDVHMIERAFDRILLETKY